MKKVIANRTHSIAVRKRPRPRHFTVPLDDRSPTKTVNQTLWRIESAGYLDRYNKMTPSQKDDFIRLLEIKRPNIDTNRWIGEFYFSFEEAVRIAKFPLGALKLFMQNKRKPIVKHYMEAGLSARIIAIIDSSNNTLNTLLKNSANIARFGRIQDMFGENLLYEYLKFVGVGEGWSTMFKPIKSLEYIPAHCRTEFVKSQQAQLSNKVAKKTNQQDGCRVFDLLELVYSKEVIRTVMKKAISEYKRNSRKVTIAAKQGIREKYHSYCFNVLKWAISFDIIEGQPYLRAFILLNIRDWVDRNSKGKKHKTFVNAFYKMGQNAMSYMQVTPTFKHSTIFSRPYTIEAFNEFKRIYSKQLHKKLHILPLI